MNCIHFRGTVFIHVGPEQLCMCFDLHVECCGSCMVITIGVGAGKFLGCEGFLPKFSHTCPKSFGRLCLQIFSLKGHEDLFWDDLHNRSSCGFLQTLGAIL